MPDMGTDNQTVLSIRDSQGNLRDVYGTRKTLAVILFQDFRFRMNLSEEIFAMIQHLWF